MAKGKSSASSATRKKHARKAAGPGGPSDEPFIPKDKKLKGKEKGKKGKEPKKKVYIPPVKPARVRPDPLDTLGVAQIVPAELLVILRKFAKKDSVTKRRALEDFLADWVEKARTEEWRLSAVVDALPVWLHHVPTLFLHPSRRIRSLAVTLHASLLKLPSPVPDQLFVFLRDVADADQAEHIIGTWCMTAFDVDRQVAAAARNSWNKFTSLVTNVQAGAAGKGLQLSEEKLHQLWDLVLRVLLDPGGVYLYINPPAPVVPPPPSQRRGAARTQPVVNDDEASGRNKGEEDEEEERDRNARLRISAFGAAEWILNAYFKLVQEDTKLDEFIKPLDNLALWSALYHGQDAPFAPEAAQAFGFAQPGVNRAAWAFLLAVIQKCGGRIEPLVPTLSAATLGSAWVEPDPGVRSAMWQPLMTFLKAHPEAWQIASNPPTEAADDEDDSASEDEAEHPKTPKLPAAAGPSVPYGQFRQFLELGCMGTPTVGYPAVLVILSTVPSSVLASVASPLNTLFTSFWAAVDGRALSGLDRKAASAAFLSSVLECSVFMARRLLSSNGQALLSEDEADPKTAVRTLVGDQVNRAWEEVSSQRLAVDEKLAAQYMTRTLDSMKQIDEDLAVHVWEGLAASIRASLAAKDQSIPTLLPAVVQSFRSSFVPDSRLAQANKELTEEIIRSIISQVEQLLGPEHTASASAPRLASLVLVLDVFGSELFDNAEIVSRIDGTLSDNAYRLLLLSPRVLQMYFAYRGDEERSLSLWHDILRATADHPDELSRSLPSLLDIVKDDKLAKTLRPSADELESVVSHLLVSSSQRVKDTTDYALLQQLLLKPEPFLSRECFAGTLSTICLTCSQSVEDLLHGRAASADGLLPLLRIVSHTNVVASLPDESVLTLLRDSFVAAFIVPSLDSHSTGEPLSEAVALWNQSFAQFSPDTQLRTLGLVKERLREILIDCGVQIEPARLVSILVEGVPHFPPESLDEDVLRQHDLNDTLSNLGGQPSSASLAVTDPLVLPGDWDEPDATPGTFDKTGLSSYARLASTLLLYCLQRRDIARNNIWALHHLYALRLYAQDALDVPLAPSAVFATDVSRALLRDLITKVDQIAAYLLAESHEDGGLTQIALRLGQNKPSAGSDDLEQLLRVLIRTGKTPDALRDARILRTILQHLFAGASRQDAEQFLVLARSIEKTDPYASLAITFAVTQYAPEPPRLDRLRNELAANMLGISAAKANTDGLWTLRRLVAVAPDPESDIVYLPNQRAVNLMRACQQWIASYEDLDEEVDNEMTAVFFHLVPILQNVPGSHWDLIYDLVENNLEICSFDEETTLPLLSRTLRLVIVIEDLTSTNKSMRSTWDERRSTVLTMIRDLVSKKSDNNIMSTPLSVCRELALTIVQHLPQSLIGNDTLSKMCHLVADASETVPQMAYKILREAAKKRTEYMVVEAGVDTEEAIQLELPLELVALLYNVPDEDLDERSDNHGTFGYLLAWMLTFDLFTNASLKVKSAYTDHLRQECLVEDCFLPHIFTILHLYGGSTRPFKLDIWEVDEFYLEMYTADTPIGLPLLAAHLYYRALLLVPSLIRNWLLDCRDRQLSVTVSNYTSTYFSPAIIHAELSEIKDPSRADDIAGENFTVKVANATSEITAAFAVDEYSLELVLKLPSDFPLHTIMTKDSNSGRAGVAEDRWRAWILGVHQILTFRSGSIVDGLTFFKKNVTSHFEGQTECPICYSMISSGDFTLPKKPCRTCKNKFHSSCLYKWFNSSHSSTCPLCRSEILS
ncbi:hypothetical protein BDW22DRAFT_1358876 [Trametopsis cervina]|nr:hypothetical protein BDW22DRAFT_1358876 [Trametopsis cervina]